MRIPPHLISQYGQGHIGGSNETAPKDERSIDCLYIGRKDNGSRHWVSKLSTKEKVSVNRFTLIPMNQDHIQRVNVMGKEDDKYDNTIEFADYHGKVTILD